MQIEGQTIRLSTEVRQAYKQNYHRQNTAQQPQEIKTRLLPKTIGGELRFSVRVYRSFFISYPYILHLGSIFEIHVPTYLYLKC